MSKEVSSTAPAVDKPASTTPEPLPDTLEIGRRLGAGAIHVERLVHEGMPHIDIGIHGNKDGRRRTLRFVWADVLRWLQGRNGADR